jgi:hypothetical protein
MKTFQFITVLSVLAATVGAFEMPPALNVTGNSYSFGGSNSYFIHGTSDAEKREWVNTLADWGAKVVRIWGKNFYCSVKLSIRKYDLFFYYF